MFQYTAKQRTIRMSEKIKNSGLQGKVLEMLTHFKKMEPQMYGKQGGDITKYSEADVPAAYVLTPK